MAYDSVSIIGCGNVGSNLASTLRENDIAINFVLSKKHKSSQLLASKVDAQVAFDIDDIPSNDLVLLCVPDDQVARVINSLPPSQKIAYTSGSVELNEFKKRDLIGVFYPLQTFTTGKTIDLHHVPFFIESMNEEFGDSLFELANRISDDVRYSNSEERKKIHLAAVMVNNFTNHILHQAQAYSEENKIDFRVFLPLLKETVSKLDSFSALDAQTGPARRDDQSVINSHLEMLDPNQAAIYRVLSDSIHQLYKKDEGEL